MQISASQVKALRERTGAGMMECKKALVSVNGDIEAAVEEMRKAGLAAADKKSGRVAAEGIIAIAARADGRAAALAEVNCETDFVAKEGAFREFAQAVAERVLADDPSALQALGASPVEAGSDATIEQRRRELIARIGENMTVRRFVRLVAESGVIATYSHGGRIGVVVAAEGPDEGTVTVARDIAMHVAASRPQYLSESDVPQALLEKERSILAAQAEDSGKPARIIEKMVAGRLRKYLREITLLGQPFVKDPELSVEKYLKGKGVRVIDYRRLEVGEGIERREENFAEEVMAQVRGA